MKNNNNEERLFNSSIDKLKYKVVIEVFENCARTNVVNEGEKLELSYHELIGVLEAQKQHIIWTQREHNLTKSMKKRNQNERPKKNSRRDFGQALPTE